MSMSTQNNHTHPAIQYIGEPVIWPTAEKIETLCKSETIYGISSEELSLVAERASTYVQNLTAQWLDLSSNGLCNYRPSNKSAFIQTVLNRLRIMPFKPNERNALDKFEKDLGDPSPDFLNNITSKCGVILFGKLANIRAKRAASVFYQVACAFNFPKNWVQIVEENSNQTALDPEIETNEKIKGFSSPTFYLMSSFIFGLGVSLGMVILKITQRINKAAYEDIALEDRQEDIEEVEQSDTSQA